MYTLIQHKVIRDFKFEVAPVVNKKGSMLTFSCFPDQI